MVNPGDIAGNAEEEEEEEEVKYLAPLAKIAPPWFYETHVCRPVFALFFKGFGARILCADLTAIDSS